MAVTIKLKRGSGAPADDALSQHEVAMDPSAGNIYVGVDNAGTIEANILANKYDDAAAVNAIETATLVDMQNDLTVQGELTTSHIELPSGFNPLTIYGNHSHPQAGSLAGSMGFLPINYNAFDLPYFSMTSFTTPNGWAPFRMGAEEPGTDSNTAPLDNGSHNSVMFMMGGDNKLMSHQAGNFGDTSPLLIASSGLTLENNSGGANDYQFYFKTQGGVDRAEGKLHMCGSLYDPNGTDTRSQQHTADGNTDVFALTNHENRKIVSVEVNSVALADDEYSVDNDSVPPSVDLTGGDNPYGTPGNGDTVELFSGGNRETSYEFQDSSGNQVFRASRVAWENFNGTYQTKYAQLELGRNADDYTEIFAKNAYWDVDGLHNIKSSGVTNLLSTGNAVNISSASSDPVNITGQSGNQLEVGSQPFVKVNADYGTASADVWQFIRQNNEDGVNDGAIADGTQAKFNFLIKSADGSAEQLMGGFTTTTHSTDGNEFQITLDNQAQTGSVNNVNLTETNTVFSKPVKLPAYNVGNAPSSATEGEVIFVTDGDAGSKCLAVYDGTDWKVVSLGATIST